MGARELLDDLIRAGMTVEADADRLIVKPASKLTDDLRAAVREAKPGLLALVSAGPYALSAEDAARAHAERWDAAACARFVARAGHLMRIGFHATDADDLAERLHLRDLSSDGRRMCTECRHYQRNATDPCGNHAKAGPRLRGPNEATTLQWCSGFDLFPRLEENAANPHGS